MVPLLKDYLRTRRFCQRGFDLVKRANHRPLSAGFDQFTNRPDFRTHQTSSKQMSFKNVGLVRPAAQKQQRHNVCHSRHSVNCSCSLYGATHQCLHIPKPLPGRLRPGFGIRRRFWMTTLLQCTQQGVVAGLFAVAACLAGRPQTHFCKAPLACSTRAWRSLASATGMHTWGCL